MNRGREFKLILNKINLLLKFHVQPICFLKWQFSKNKIEFILFWVSVQTMLLSFSKVQIKPGGKISLFYCSQTPNYPKYQTGTSSIFHNQTYQIPCKVYPITWDLDPISSYSLENLTTLAIDSLIYPHFQTLLFYCILSTNSQARSKVPFNLKKKKNLPLKPLPWFFHLSLCNSDTPADALSS